MRTQLFGVKPADPLTLAVATVVLIGAALIRYLYTGLARSPGESGGGATPRATSHLFQYPHGFFRERGQHLEAA